ncbi:MAG: Crp/Fnr family transcriptional regulator [Desulfovibrio sp.]
MLPKKNALQHIVHALQADKNLNLAPPSSLSGLARKATRLHFKKGDYIFKSEEQSTRFYLVENGQVIMSKESLSGKSFTYLMATRGFTLNAITCFKLGTYMFSARAIDEVSIISIPSADFRNWVLCNPEVCNGILSTMGDLLNGAYTRIIDLVDESAEKRISNVLCMLSTRIGLKLSLTNSDIAEMAGTSRETAARTISRLQESGTISKSRGSIHILDKEQLDQITSSPFFII